MPLDILIIDSHGNTEKSIPLYIEEYDFIIERLENIDGFELTRKALSNYYGEYEIYLDDLDNLKAEILELNKLLRSSYSESLSNFINNFLQLINSAILLKRTIKFIGD